MLKLAREPDLNSFHADMAEHLYMLDEGSLQCEYADFHNEPIIIDLRHLF
jgi:hypothetical protein